MLYSKVFRRHIFLFPHESPQNYPLIHSFCKDRMHFFPLHPSILILFLPFLIASSHTAHYHKCSSTLVDSNPPLFDHSESPSSHLPYISRMSARLDVQVCQPFHNDKHLHNIIIKTRLFNQIIFENSMGYYKYFSLPSKITFLKSYLNMIN